MTGDFHPTDRYSRSAAKTTNYTKLVLNFEDAVRAGHADVELIAAVAIARVEVLERQLQGRPEVRGNRRLASVVPIRRNEAPAPFERPGA